MKHMYFKLLVLIVSCEHGFWSNIVEVDSYTGDSIITDINWGEWWVMAMDWSSKIIRQFASKDWQVWLTHLKKIGMEDNSFGDRCLVENKHLWLSKTL